MNTPRQLREYQQIARDRTDAEWESGVTRTAIVWPTGIGKTDYIADACIDEVAKGGRVLVLAHRSELLDQLTERIAAYSKIPVGRIQAAQNDIGYDLIIAMVQSMCRPKRQAALDAIGWVPTLVVIDEVHHALAKSYLMIARWAGCFDQRRTKLLGVTATLTRGDGQQFDDLFESVADVVTPEWAISQQLLVKYSTKRIKLERRGDRFRQFFRPLTSRGLDERDSQRIAQEWLRKAENRITIVYTSSIKLAHMRTAAFQDAGVPVALVIGSTPYEDRQVIYKKLAAGEIRVMVNVGVATEGFDCPQVSCILLDRYTESPGFLTQMIGRGLRPCIDPRTGKPWIDPRTGRAKTDCRILDTTGVTDDFDLSTLIDIDPRRIHGGQRSRIRSLWESLTGRR